MGIPADAVINVVPNLVGAAVSRFLNREGYGGGQLPPQPGIPTNAVTLSGQVITLASQILTLGAAK